MSQTLEGCYYQATAEGYTNRGRQVIKLSSKINHIPVYSRCNELLKSQSHPIHFISTQKLQEVHCAHKPYLSDLQLNKTLKNNHQSAVSDGKNRKQLVIKFYKENQNTNNINLNNQPKFNNKQNPQNDYLNNEQEQKTFVKYQLNTPRLNKQGNVSFNNSLQNQTIDQNQNDGKNYNHEKLLATKKNYLKQNICLTSLKKKILEKQSDYKLELNEQKTTFVKDKNNRKNIDQQTDNSDQQCITEHAVYETNHKKRNNQFQQKILQQLQNMTLKVKNMQTKLKQNEEQFKLKLLQQELKQTESKLQSLQQQNIKLKNYSQFCCHNSQNGNQVNLIYLFGMFLFGLIFARAVFC